MIRIDSEKCIGCGMCQQSCFFGAIEMNGALPLVNEQCVFCGACKKACPADAIELPEQAGKPGDLSQYRDIWVFIETDADQTRLKKVSLELLSEARKLADRLGERVSAVLLCARIPERFEELISGVGCDTARVVQDEKLGVYDTNIFAGAVSDLARKHRPAGILFPATELGRDLAPRVSCELRVGLTADCTSLDLDEKRNLVQIRPTYGGNIMASIISPNHRPQLASIRPNVLSVVQAKKACKCVLVREELPMEKYTPKARYLGSVEKDVIFKDIVEAQILVVAGYGIGSKANFKKLERLAVKMNAAIGATRKVVDEGWAPFEIQVGQTGKTVAPDIYIGCGVSGALQHSIGIKNAKLKIAVNTDPAAPIFGISDVAIMGDCIEVSERLCERLG